MKRKGKPMRNVMMLLGLAALPALAVAQNFGGGGAWDANPLRDGLDFGARWGYYRYSENPNFMELEGSRAVSVEGAVQTDVSLPYLGQRALRFEGRLGQSSDAYSSGSGFTNGNKSTVGEGRLLLVSRMDLGNVTLNPYFGYGYRHLTNDLKDVGASKGYQRISQYHYLPLGTWASVSLQGDNALVAQAEVAPLLHGSQHSGIGSGIDNTQSSGNHMRAFIGWRTGRWTVGPYAEWWHVGNSTVDCNSTGTCGYEPSNFTREVGLKATVHFGGK